MPELKLLRPPSSEKLFAFESRFGMKLIVIIIVLSVIGKFCLLRGFRFTLRFKLERIVIYHSVFLNGCFLTVHRPNHGAGFPKIPPLETVKQWNNGLNFDKDGVWPLSLAEF
ncbi:MAG: hypothetical protein ACR2IH_13805 [Pyrinomonadaceae bacterium]